MTPPRNPNIVCVMKASELSDEDIELIMNSKMPDWCEQYNDEMKDDNGNSN